MAKVKIKFNPVREVIEGRSVVVVDDSLVRGTTSKGLVHMIRSAGAREVHFRLCSPPITGPCHYGIDTPTREELIARHPLDRGDPQLPGRGFPGLSLARRNAPRRRPDGRARHFCHACFSGDYPTPVDEDLVQIRHVTLIAGHRR